jgi:hypothetical protein
VYRKIANGSQRIHVTNEGNVVPWLMATKAVIHNGCTTGVEAYVTGTPAISYRASINETYDNGFYRLPNKMSHQCFTFEELQDVVRKVLTGKVGAADGDKRRSLIDHHMAGKTGPLACERMVDILEKISVEAPGEGSISRRTQRWLVSQGLHLAKAVKYHLPGSHNRPEFQKHRFPGIAPDKLAQRIKRFQQLLGKTKRLQVDPISDVLVRIGP